MMQQKESAKVLLLVFILIICLIFKLVLIKGLLIILGFYVLVHIYYLFEKNKKHPLYLFFYHINALVILAIAIILYEHLFSGFNNILIFDKIQVSKDAVPFTMYFNTDETLAGLILFYFVISHSQQTNLKFAFKKAWYLFLIAIFLLMGLTLIFNFVKVDYKLHDYFIIWALNNLLAAAMAEEVLFRGFLQRHLSFIIKSPEVIAVIITALGFGALHWKGGIEYVMYASIAGVMYGLIYQKSKNIIFSILSHFFLNLIHIIFFTYPFLK